MSWMIKPRILDNHIVMPEKPSKLKQKHILLGKLVSEEDLDSLLHYLYNYSPSIRWDIARAEQKSHNVISCRDYPLHSLVGEQKPCKINIKTVLKIKFFSVLAHVQTKLQNHSSIIDLKQENLDKIMMIKRTYRLFACWIWDSRVLTESLKEDLWGVSFCHI